MKFRLMTLLLALTCCGAAWAQGPFAGNWHGKLEVGNNASLTLVFNIAQDGKAELSCTLDSPDQGVKGIEAEAAVENGFMLVVNVPKLGAGFKGMLVGNSLVGTFTQMGHELPLSMVKGSECLNRPQTPTGPFPYLSEEVSFTNSKAGATLAGTLLIPEGATQNTPVVLFVTGSGLQNRNEEIFEHKPFLVIADYLAHNGIASLRYDDRTFAQSSGGDVQNATTLDFMEDALAGVNYLKACGRFGKVGIVGHSEGACIALMLGARGQIDFAVSLAAIGVKGDEALTAQSNRILELSGAAQRLTVEEYRENVRKSGNSWLNWFIDYDPTSDIKACKCPVFAANGNKDIQIISSLNLTAIQANLPATPNNIIKEYPSLNHLFQHCRSGMVMEYRQIEESFSPEVLADITAWLKAL